MSLEVDLKEHPCLVGMGEQDLEELRQQLVAAHKYLLSDRPNLYCYLYQKQVALNRKLKETNHG